MIARDLDSENATTPLPPGDAGTTRQRMDALAAAKLRLMAAGDEVRPAERVVYQHPYASAAVALAAGLMLSRMPVMRKVAGLAAAWAVKRAVRQYLARRLGS